MLEEPVQTKEELHNARMKKLFDIFKQENALQQEKKDILIGLSDKEKIKRLFELIQLAHKGVLKSKGMQELEDILMESFGGDIDDFEFFKKNKNSRFYKAKDLIAESKKIPEEAEILNAMKSTKSFNEREVSKSRTYNHHIKHMHNSKQIHELKLQIEELQKLRTMDKFEQTMNFAGVYSALSDLTKRVDDNSNRTQAIDEIVEEVVKINEKYLDPRKVLAYRMRLENPKVTNKQVADKFGVSVSTIKRWAQEVKEVVE